MAEHLNRLDNKDALEFDKAFKQFCKTGAWNMNKEKQRKEILIDIANSDLCKLKTNSLMADPNENIMGRGRFPGSRDWDMESLNIICDQTKCAANKKSFGIAKCIMPSLIAIDSHGKCVGFHPRKKIKKGKNNG